jgi:hypothetical protein
MEFENLTHFKRIFINFNGSQLNTNFPKNILNSNNFVTYSGYVLINHLSKNNKLFIFLNNCLH